MTAEARPNLVRRPLLGAAFAFLLGSLVTPILPVGVHVVFTLGLILSVAWLALRRRVLAALLLPLVFLFLGVCAGVLRLPPTETITRAAGRAPGTALLLEGFVAEAPELRSDGETFLLDVTGTATVPTLPLEPAEGRVKVRIRSTPGPTQPPCGDAGDRVRVWARLFEPEPALMPRGPSARTRAARQGVSLLAGASSKEDCLLLEPRGQGGLRTAIQRLRTRMHLGIARVLGGEEEALVRALSTGDRAALPRSLSESFRRSGLSHLLAISGLHLAVVSGLLFALLTWLLGMSPSVALRFGAARAAAALTLPFVFFYTLLVGASPSATRAAIMVGALLVGRILRRQSEPWSALSFAAILTVALDPSTLGDVSFQLSFAAVAGLMRIFPALQRAVGRDRGSWPPVKRLPVDLFLVSAAATIGTAPLVLRHFQRLSLIGLVANLPATPLASICVVPLSLAGATLSSVSPTLAEPVLRLAGVSAGALAGLARGAATVPGAAVFLPAPTIAECVLFYLGTILLSVAAGRQGLRRAGWAVCLLVVASLSSGGMLRALRSDVRVAFLPVGQGDAALIELPRGGVMLVDAGPRSPGFDAAERVVAPYLRTRRISSIDVLVLSHSHEDHAGGVRTLARQFGIREIWWSGEAPESLMTELGDVVFRRMDGRSPPRQFGSAQVEVLAPPDDAPAPRQANEASLVLKLSQGERSVLFTGDIGSEAEAELLSRSRARLRADVLKVAHHGSSRSSTDEFLAAVQPSIAVISVGKHSRFDLPDEGVIARLGSRGAAVFRTDQNGLVVVELSSTAVRARPFHESGAPPPPGR